MIYLFYFSIILIANIIQTTDIIKFFTLMGQVQPNFVLLIVIFVNIQEKNSMIGEGTGFLVGLLEDFLSVGLFGLNAFLKTIISFVVNLFKDKFYIENFFFAFLFVFLVSIVYSFFYLILESVLVGNIVFWKNFIQLAFPSALYNGILAPLIFPFLKWMRNKIILFRKDK